MGLQKASRKISLKKKNNYIDNEKLYKALVAHKANVKLSLEAETEKPRVPEYIGLCIYEISQHLSLSGNFVNYTFREDMVGDGYENCIRYLDNFNVEKYFNPHTYFTTICYWAFVRRIKDEKKQLYVKQKSLENSYLFGILEETQASDGKSYVGADLDNEYMNNLVKDFESKLDENKKKTKPRAGVEIFYEEDKTDE